MKICKGLVKLSFAKVHSSQTGRKTSLQLRYLDIYLMSKAKAMAMRLWLSGCERCVGARAARSQSRTAAQTTRDGSRAQKRTVLARALDPAALGCRGWCSRDVSARDPPAQLSLCRTRPSLYQSALSLQPDSHICRVIFAYWSDSLAVSARTRRFAVSLTRCHAPVKRTLGWGRAAPTSSCLVDIQEQYVTSKDALRGCIDHTRGEKKSVESFIYPHKGCALLPCLISSTCGDECPVNQVEELGFARGQLESPKPCTHIRALLALLSRVPSSGPSGCAEKVTVTQPWLQMN